MRSIYNAYKTLFYRKIMSVTTATDNYFLEFYNERRILVYMVQNKQCKQPRRDIPKCSELFCFTSPM